MLKSCSVNKSRKRPQDRARGPATDRPPRPLATRKAGRHSRPVGLSLSRSASLPLFPSWRGPRRRARAGQADLSRGRRTRGMRPPREQRALQWTRRARGGGGGYLGPVQLLVAVGLHLPRLDRHGRDIQICSADTDTFAPSTCNEGRRSGCGTGCARLPPRNQARIPVTISRLMRLPCAVLQNDSCMHLNRLPFNQCTPPLATGP